MAVERRDPVPPGRYWVYLDKEEIPTWAKWLEQFPGSVRVIATEVQAITPHGVIWAIKPDLEIIKTAVGEWILFDVLRPVPWVGFGFPTIVTDPNVKGTSDVMTAPVPEDSVDRIKNLVLLGGAIYIVGMLLSRKYR